MKSAQKILAAVALLVGTGVACRAWAGFGMGGGLEWGMDTATEVLKQFAVPRHMSRSEFGISRWDDKNNIEQFAADKCDILVYRALPDQHEAELLKQRFPADGPQPIITAVACGQVAAVINSNIPLRSLTLDQVRSILRMKDGVSHWKDLAVSGGAIKSYGEKRDDASRLVIRHVCMMLGPKFPTGYYLYRDDFEQCDDGDEVLEKVRKDPNGIGFLLYHGQPLKGVKLVAIGVTDKGPFVLPSSGAIINKDYPLQEPLVLYLHPNAPPLAKEFCEFAAGKEGSAIMQKMGLLTTYASAEAEAGQRVAQMKAGKGVRITAVGPAETTRLLRDLAERYTHDTATVQLGYLPANGPAALGEFLGGEGGGGAGKDLLLLPGKIEDLKLAPATKAAWDAKFKDDEGKCICGRAAAVIVNAVNPLDSLSEAQLASVFSGKSRAWKDAGAQGKANGEAEIRWYGVGGDDAAEMLAARKLDLRGTGRLIRQASEQETQHSVAADPQGIAVVDLAELPGDLKKAGIKVLAVGEGNDAVAPTSDTVLDGSYPLATRYYLYVSPAAGGVARDFAKYLSTPAAGSNVFTKDGFICAPAGPH